MRANFPCSTSAFFVDGSGGDRIRLSFATLTPDELGEAARRLARALTSAG